MIKTLQIFLDFHIPHDQQDYLLILWDFKAYKELFNLTEWKYFIAHTFHNEKKKQKTEKSFGMR